ncbi:MAG: SH3 domain-containing protein, partial [Candidatus Dormibacteria bacterium]
PPSPKPPATPTATPVPTTLTVIAPLGVNMRSGPSTTDQVVGVLAQGVSLPIVAHTSTNGGWWQVRGSSQTGWVTADPDYTSTQTFQTFSSSGTQGWSVLYQQGWTFAESSPNTVVFSTSDGDTITVVVGSSTSTLPSPSPSAAQASASSIEVFGVTTTLATYEAGSGYQAAVAFQAQSGLAFLIETQAPSKTGRAAFNLFLQTFIFSQPAASPS